MLRMMLLVISSIIGLYFFEVYTGRSFGVETTFREIGHRVSAMAGMSGAGGSALGYGTATSVGQSSGRSVKSLGSGIGSNIGSVGRN